jgi:DNA-binding response OmpR family regulator
MPKNILVVEDDKILRELISQKLEKENYKISAAIDGEEGLKKVKEEKPDIVLLDLILPGIDGFEVLERIKQDPEINKIPVVILSNLGQKEEIEKGLKLGATDYLIKAHFTLSEIVEKVKTILK